jgi:hypothetical protein
MPIVRTYACGDCGHFMDVTLTMEQWDAPAPDCPRCASGLRQEFKPVALGGSAYARARTLAEDIAHNDYGVADMAWRKDREVAQGTPHRLKDETPQSVAAATGSNWGVTGEALQQAVALGRQVRLNHGGSGLDILQNALKDGTQPDLIEASKRRAMKVW